MATVTKEAAGLVIRLDDDEAHLDVIVIEPGPEAERLRTARVSTWAEREPHLAKPSS